MKVKQFILEHKSDPSKNLKILQEVSLEDPITINYKAMPSHDANMAMAIYEDGWQI